MLSGVVVKAQSYNVTGVWNTPFGGTVQFFQKGKNVQFIYINANYAHYANYSYTTDTRYEGTLTRVNRASGCTTYINVVGVVESNNSISEFWQGKDSNCDLTPTFSTNVKMNSRVN